MASREGRGSWTANGRTDGRGRTRTGGRVTRAAFHFAGGACPIRRPLPPSLPRPHCPKNGGVTEQVLQMDSSHPTERVGAKLQGRGGAGRSENLLGVITASLSWSIIWISLFHADKEVTAREGWRGRRNEPSSINTNQRPTWALDCGAAVVAAAPGCCKTTVRAVRVILTRPTGLQVFCTAFFSFPGVTDLRCHRSPMHQVNFSHDCHECQIA